jgi:protein-S-isoprenylcysteine O-methyltransferase Ste14
MSQTMIDNIYSIATGNSKKRMLLTPVGALVFITVTGAFIAVPLLLENVLNIPRLGIQLWNLIVSIPIIFIGLFYTLWSLLIFFRSKGTPVPFNPPPELIVTGPYKSSRNPMTAGLFLQMFGLGILLGSVLLTFVFTPLYMLVHIRQLKKIEEPELEKRLGSAYVEYKKKVPMFFPWKKV